MDEKEKKLLLKLARDSIESYFEDKKPNMDSVKQFSEKRGVFVTLHDKRGKLRGCIGFPTAIYALNMAIVESARSAAFRDPRFPPVAEDELKDLTIEISVLSKPELIKIEHYNDYSKKIIIGEDGLILEGPYGSGLLLPQVATENAFNVAQFLNCLSQKAGLGFSDWKDKSNRIYKFHAEIFSEKKRE